MARKALKKMQEEMDKLKKRYRDDETTLRPRKQTKMRKLKYKLEEEDWGSCKSWRPLRRRKEQMAGFWTPK